VLLIDAQQGLVTQTRRHAHLVSLVGIRQVVLAINKMDLVHFNADVFQRIVKDFAPLIQQLGFDDVTAIPLSALHGDNVTARSAHTPWYTGPTLLGHLESVPTIARHDDEQFVFPVQWVNRPDADFRGLSGTVSNGRVSVGDTVRIAASNQTAKVKRVVTLDGDLPTAAAGDAVTLVLDRDVDASRGDVLSVGAESVETTDQFEATVVWMHHDAGHVGRNYDFKLSHQWAGAALTNIRHRLDVNTGGHEPARHLALNDIAVCQLALSQRLAFGAYSRLPTLGRFILVDRFSQHTVAAGMISHSLRRAQNVHRQTLNITREDREHQNGHRGLVVWFTGLSGSGKSTVANALEMALHAEGKRTYVLDGDNVRHGLNRDLGFTDADRVENIRRLAEVAKLMLDAGLIVITAFISPFRAERQMARELIGESRFVEVFVETPLDVCEQRDPKGLYKKARSGQLPNMTGIDSPYEPPLRPELTLDTSILDLDSATKKVLQSIQAQLFNR
jgi:bifunctional enzyme CysN/CysC